MNIQNKNQLKVLTFALIMVVVLGIGYAGITAINLVINGEATASVDQNNFKVKFLSEENVTPTITGGENNTVEVVDDSTAKFSVNTLTAEGDSEVATFRVRNDSKGIGAEITLNLTSSNTKYFKVTETILDDKLQAGEETTAKVKVEMIKTPITDSVTTSITATLTASPLEDAEATGGDEKELVKPISYVYSLTSNSFNKEITGTTYPNFNAAKTNFGHPASIAHILEGGLIKESYVTFERNGEVYYLRGGAGDEFGKASMPVYDANVAVLKEAFGPTWSDYCSESVVRDYRSFSCNVDELYAYAGTDGGVHAGDYGWSWGCDVNDGGGSICYS